MSESRPHTSRDDLTDDELFAELRQGAAASDQGPVCEELLRRYRNKVFGWCLSFLGNEESAADITQEVFVSLLESPGRYAARDRFGAWLYVVTRSRCLNAIRSGKSGRLTDLDETLAATLQAADDPAKETERSEIAKHVQQACARELDVREQAIIHLRYYWGLKLREITSLLRLENASGARTYLRTAEKKLRKALAELDSEMRPGAKPQARWVRE